MQDRTYGQRITATAMCSAGVRIRACACVEITRVSDHLRGRQVQLLTAALPTVPRRSHSSIILYSTTFF